MEIYLGTKEIPNGSNRGKFIDIWNKNFGLVGAYWCATIQSAMNKDGNADPKCWSTVAQGFIKAGHTYKLSDVIYGAYVIKPGDYRIKATPGKAHIDMFVSWDTLKQEGLIIGGNVSNSVKVRAISLKSMMFDGTTHITSVTGNYNYDLYPAVPKPKDSSFKVTATYYHDDFNGKKTASGQRFDNSKFTAAHKTLPMGTNLLVTNEKNNKRVTVVVNDRIKTEGVLDLTSRAAKAIGISKGKVLVKIMR